MPRSSPIERHAGEENGTTRKTVRSRKPKSPLRRKGRIGKGLCGDRQADPPTSGNVRQISEVIALIGWKSKLTPYRFVDKAGKGSAYLGL